MYEQSDVHTSRILFFLWFFFNDTATTEIYTLSLHDALPICSAKRLSSVGGLTCAHCWLRRCTWVDRKSTRLNSSHSQISYAVCWLKTTTPHLTTALPPRDPARHDERGPTPPAG